MRKMSFVVMSAILAFAVGCGGSKPKDQIVGKWDMLPPAEMPKEMADAMKATMEFKSNGDFDMSIMGMSKSGKYKFTADDMMEAEVDGKAKKLKVEIKGDEMTTTEQDGKKEVTKFKKAK